MAYMNCSQFFGIVDGTGYADAYHKEDALCCLRSLPNRIGRWSECPLPSRACAGVLVALLNGLIGGLHCPSWFSRGECHPERARAGAIGLDCALSRVNLVNRTCDHEV
jgi:hypothetical protein